MRTVAFWFFLICLGIVAPQRLQAQATCPDLVLEAVETVGSGCAEMGRNSVCYGNHRLGAVLTRPLSVEFFNQPSDQLQLADLQSLSTSPLDLERQEWGIAVMSLQANVPQALPGQVVTFLLIGDAEVRNDSPLSPDALQPVSTNAATSLFTQPAADSAILTTLEANTALSAAGVTADGVWLRVVHHGEFGWMLSSFAAAPPQNGRLPIVDAQTPLPMQAFTFRAAVGGPRCAESPPSVLVVQGPEQVRVSLTVNGAQMDLGSTAVLWQPEDQVMQMAILDGQAQLADGTTVTTGTTSTIQLGENHQTTGQWTAPRPLTVFEIAALLPLEQMPETLVNYPLNLLEEGEATPTPPVTPTRVYIPPRPTATPIPPTLTPAPVVSFTADSLTIAIEQCTTLRWFTQNIDSVYIDGAPTVGESSLQVCPPRTQTYTLLVVFRDGAQQSYSLTIQVDGPTSAPQPVCGNQICEPGESMLNCTADCPEPVCGNRVCEPYEDACTCGQDCGGSCEAS